MFDFEYKNLKFSYVSKFFQKKYTVSIEIHANCPQGEEFLINEDNYEDAFFAGKHIFTLIRTKELEDARKLCIQEQQTTMPSGKMETTH